VAITDLQQFTNNRVVPASMGTRHGKGPVPMVSTELSPVLDDRTFPPIIDGEVRKESPAIDN